MLRCALFAFADMPSRGKLRPGKGGRLEWRFRLAQRQVCGASTIAQWRGTNMCLYHRPVVKSPDGTALKLVPGKSMDR